jgi:cytochrome b561
MRATNTDASWGWVARALHWSMAAIILYQLGLGLWMANFVEDLIRQFQLTQTHKSWGFVLFVLALVRIAWRLLNRARPGLPLGMPAWQIRAAAASHGLLYALMLVMPLSGWAYASASPLQDLLGIDNEVFGLITMPDPWVPGNEAVADLARAIHRWSAVLLGLVLAVHVAAALKHHLVDRDGVLARMAWGR